ncbi:MAG: hypothetical protein L6R40_001525 [Gallowayella cf. fulva]|nr:MAG: hypothetical protein L6R40_001525 [Xanthomendoza cf. fulva]
MARTKTYAAEPDYYSALTVPALKELLRNLSIDFEPSAKKRHLINLLEEADEEYERGGISRFQSAHSTAALPNHTQSLWAPLSRSPRLSKYFQRASLLQGLQDVAWPLLIIWTLVLLWFSTHPRLHVISLDFQDCAPFLELYASHGCPKYLLKRGSPSYSDQREEEIFGEIIRTQPDSNVRADGTVVPEESKVEIITQAVITEDIIQAMTTEGARQAEPPEDVIEAVAIRQHRHSPIISILPICQSTAYKI